MENAFYAAVHDVADLSENKCDISKGSKGHVSELCLAAFDPFCLFLLLVVRYDND